MCGIAGIVKQRGAEVHSVVQNTAAALRYRGPVDSGVWSDHTTRLRLGHAWLSVLSLAPKDRSPILSASGRHIVSYNEEGYYLAGLRFGLESGIACDRTYAGAQQQTTLTLYRIPTERY